MDAFEPKATDPVSSQTASSAALAAETLLSARDVAGARQALDEAIAAAAKADAPARAAFCAAQGEAQRLQPDPMAAMRTLRSALALAESGRASASSARGAFRLALTALDRSPSPSGATRGQRGLELADARAEYSQMRPAGPISEVCAQAKDINDLERLALFALQCAADRAAEAGETRLAAQAGLRLARLKLNWPEPNARAEAAADARTALTRALSDTSSDWRLLVRGAETVLDAGLDAQSARLVEAAAGSVEAQARTAADPAEALGEAQGLMARLRLAQGRSSEAARLARAALLRTAQSRAPARTFEWWALLAQAEPEARAAHLERAYASLEGLRAATPRFEPETGESTFRTRMQPIFTAFADARIAGDDPAAWSAAQDVIEAYRQAEIEAVFGDACGSPRAPIAPAELKPGEIVFYPLVLADRVEMLVAVGGRDQAYRRLAPAQIKRADLAALTERLARAAASRTSSEALWREPAQALYDLLIKPVKADVGEAFAGATLVVLPDGPLREAPFAALSDRETGRMLIDEARLAVAPALAYADPGRALGRAPRVLAASLAQPVRVEAPVATDFDKLEHAAAEALAASPRPLTDFTVDELAGALERGRYDVVHLATHAAFNGRSDLSFIVAKDRALTLPELRDMLGRARTRGAPVELLVLSACETARGDDQAAMGLAGAAIQAGATSAVATLWKIDDAGTARLMEQFYSRYAGARDSRAEALRQAQLAQRADPTKAHPYYWAAFSLIGGWR